MKKVTVVSTSRADFAHLYWPLVRLRKHPDIDVDVIATGAHLSPEFGDTGELVGDTGVPYTAVEALLSSDTDVGMAKTIGVAVLGLADALAEHRPDILLLVADRYEMLAPASTALALRIPIAHIEGGEISEGAIDDAVRNALTKMAHIHFTPTAAARDRVIAMGEESWRVHQSGAPSIDYLANVELFGRAELEAKLGHSLAERINVVAYHPLTLSQDTLVEADDFFAALAELDGSIVFCFPNADAGSRAIIERATTFCNQRSDAELHVNLPPLTYWSLLANANLMIGNSSSGIMETGSLRLPTVNVGDRQAGRQRADNIVDAAASHEDILKAVDRALSKDFRASIATMTNPYGDGKAGEKIAKILAAAPDRETLLRKKALPVCAESGPPRFLPPDER